MRFLLSIALLLSVISGYGASFIVKNGEVETAQTLSTVGDIGIIEAGGAIVSASAPSVSMSADNQIVKNHGLTSNTGGNIGINNTGDNSQIINTNLITTSGVGFFVTAIGVRNTGSNVQIFQSGTISTVGSSAHGIQHLNGSNAYIVNGGLIETLGPGAFGVNVGGTDSLFVNNGLIRTVELGSHGVFGDVDANAKFVNTGSIETEGDSAHGIFYSATTLSAAVDFNADYDVYNAGGTIYVQGLSSDGIQDLSDNAHVINSGTIVSEQSISINFGSDPDTNPTLTLLRGSNIQGIAQAGSLNLNVETGLNLAFLMDTATGFNQLGIEAPFALNGIDFIGVIDPTGPSIHSDIAADLSDTFLNGIYRHRTAFAACCHPCDYRGIWVEGLGSYRERSASSIVPYTITQRGFLMGYESPYGYGYLNFFGGATFGEAVVDQNTQTTDFNCYVGGLSYEQLVCDHFIGLAFIAGYASLDNHRYVMYNVAPGGVEDARTSPDGFFITPEITYAHAFSSWWCQPILSGTVRYAGLFFGSYSETGSITNLTLKDQNLHLLTLRAELGFPFTDSCCSWELEPYIGGAGRFQVGGSTIKGELLGQSFRFDSGVPAHLGYFLVGVRGERSVKCFDLFLNVEVNWDSETTFRTLGEGGIGYVF
ncbi:MAG: hypothetical protein S4CHLAM2_05040 [Chlamydiales bacterium]|nr:hypothetical protein [Chlamydiales bacterium]